MCRKQSIKRQLQTFWSTLTQTLLGKGSHRSFDTPNSFVLTIRICLKQNKFPSSQQIYFPTPHDISLCSILCKGLCKDTKVSKIRICLKQNKFPSSQQIYFPTPHDISLCSILCKGLCKDTKVSKI